MNSRFICIFAVLCIVTTLCIASPTVDHAAISESVEEYLRHLRNRSLAKAPEKQWVLQLGSRRTLKHRRSNESCCRAYNAKCQACSAGTTTAEICKQKPLLPDCPTPVSDPFSGFDGTPPPLRAPITTTQRPSNRFCCRAITAECQACDAGIPIVEICKQKPFLAGCPTPAPITTTQRPPQNCCRAYNAKCKACELGITVEQLCSRKPWFSDCFVITK